MTSRLGRLVTLALSAIQLAAPAVASVSEGLFASQVIDGRAHVESNAQTDCRPPHSADCPVCRYLVDNAGTLAVAPPPVTITREQKRLAAAAWEKPATDRPAFEARGPPPS